MLSNLVAFAPGKCLHQIRADKLATGHAVACLGQETVMSSILQQTGDH
jgi:hypothetical protein